MRSAKFAPVEMPNGTWRLDVPASLSECGRRRRRFFETKGEAEAEAKKLRGVQRDRGRSLTELTSNQSQDAAAALRVLEGHDVSLLDLASDYVAKVQCTLTLERVSNDWLESRKRSKDYERFARRAIELLDDLKEQRIGAVEPEEIARCLKGYSPATRAATMRTLSAIWNYAIQRGYVKENPVRRLERPAKQKLSERPVITPKELEKLLKQCLNSDADKAAAKKSKKAMARRKPDTRLIAPLAILFFAGVRTYEMLRMDWRDVDLNEGMLDLPAKITKRARRRSIPIEPALKAWLIKHIEVNGIQQGKICPWNLKAFYKHRDSVCAEARVAWEQNMPRHSYASYWLAKHGDLNKLALHMGHIGGLEVLHQHYYRCVRQADAESYWSVLPEDDPKKSKKNPKVASA